MRLIPVDDRDAEWRAERRRKLARALGIPAAIALLFALGLVLSPGGSGERLSVVASEQIPQAQQQPQQQPQLQLPQQVPQVPQGGPPGGFGAADLTGAAADKAAAAALKKFPGDIERVTPGPGGDGYVVHVFQGDGNEVHVLVGPDFKVEGSDANRGPQGFGPGTPG